MTDDELDNDDDELDDDDDDDEKLRQAVVAVGLEI